MKVWQLFEDDDGGVAPGAGPGGPMSAPPSEPAMPPGQGPSGPGPGPSGGPEDHQVPHGWEYHTSAGLWGAGLTSNLYWIISGERMLARMKEIGLTPKQRAKVKAATARAKKNLMDWISGRNQQYSGISGWGIVPVTTPYGVFKIAGKPGTKASLGKMVKSKAQSMYKKELKALPKAVRKPIKKKAKS